jgi:hypothetical protein
MNIKIFIITFSVFLVSVASEAQTDPVSKEGRQRIESQRIAFITQRLRLTPDEATRFWPVYNEYRDALKDLREDFERPDLESISEAEAVKILDQHMEQEQRKLDLKRTEMIRLRTIIPAKKILMLQVAENAFNRELLRRLQERRKP